MTEFGDNLNVIPLPNGDFRFLMFDYIGGVELNSELNAAEAGKLARWIFDRIRDAQYHKEDESLSDDTSARKTGKEGSS